MEEQQAQANADSAAPQPNPTAEPNSRAQPNAAAQRTAEADRKRKVQALEMQRERILSERTSSPHRRSALEIALADIEEKLAELGWSIHL